MPLPRIRRIFALLVGTALGLCVSTIAHATTEAPEFLKDLLNEGEESPEPLQIKQKKRSLSMNDLVNPLVQSVSRVPEPASEAPAWVLVITGEELFERGYFRFSDLLQDIPAVDFIRPQGFYPWLTYWRGRRSTYNAQFLFLIDGLEWHDYIYGLELTDIPISSIERIEIIYGPQSVMFGSRAATGTINVITRKSFDEPGLTVAASTGLASTSGYDGNHADHFRYLADLSSFYQGPESRYSISLRYESGAIIAPVEDSEYSRSRYLADPKVWSPEVIEEYFDSKDPASDERNLALDLHYATKGRLILEGELETGLTLLSTLRGRGFQYTTDRLSPSFRSEVDALSIFTRHRAQTSRVQSETLVRWRQDNIAATDLYSGNGMPFVQLRDATSQGMEASYQIDWNTPAVLNPDDALSLVGGARYQSGFRPSNWDRQLFRSVETSDGPSLDFSDNRASSTSFRNQFIKTVSYELYALSKYSLSQTHFIDAGIRGIMTRDDITPAFRLSYVGKLLPGLTLKAISGFAYVEPSHRQLRMPATIDSNDALKAEQSLTKELGLDYQNETIGIHANVYWTRNLGVISIATNEDDDKRLENLYDAEVLGIDLGVIGMIPIGPLRKIKFWGYASYTPWMIKELNSPEAICDDLDRWSHFTNSFNGIPRRYRDCVVGDIAPLKLWAGATINPVRGVALNVLGRAASWRVTEASNPVWKLDPFAVFDASLTIQDLGIADLNVSLKINNVLNTSYLHPGYSSAEAGTNPGYWDDDTWNGSAGYRASAVPQPGRHVQVLFIYNYK